MIKNDKKKDKIDQNVWRVSITGASSQNLVTVLENGQWGLNLSVLVQKWSLQLWVSSSA